eukprot:GHVS01058326.1.p1 GENE.GHVS01058326.1~~GHVS01058326.1.p1  ORF type:complete len:235 (+),score=79.21 GHVS01058326.1:116-820(+)
MTTAHRPTWQQAMGEGSQGKSRMASTGKQMVRDLPSHKELKTRQSSSSSSPSSYSSFSRKSDAKRSLDDRESQHRHKQQRHLTLTSSAAPATSKSSERASSALAAIEDNIFPEDADDEGPAAAVGGESESDEEDELRRELEAIKQERLEEELKKKVEYAKEHEDETRDKILRGNPLLTNQSAADDDEAVGIGRAWDDDVVFKNQTKGRLKQKKTFINDAVRSDFHKKFMTKYIV